MSPKPFHTGTRVNWVDRFELAEDEEKQAIWFNWRVMFDLPAYTSNVDGLIRDRHVLVMRDDGEWNIVPARDVFHADYDDSPLGEWVPISEEQWDSVSQSHDGSQMLQWLGINAILRGEGSAP